MSEPSQRKKPLVTLCAAISLDGKLDLTEPWSPKFLPPLASDRGEGWLIDEDTAAMIPPAWVSHTRIIHSAGMHDLASCLQVTPPKTPSVRHWFCLGGPLLFRALLDARLVDNVRLLVRASIDGRRDSATLSGPPMPEFFPRSLSCRLLRMETRDGECLLHYRVLRRAQTARK